MTNKDFVEAIPEVKSPAQGHNGDSSRLPPHVSQTSLPATDSNNRLLSL